MSWELGDDCELLIMLGLFVVCELGIDSRLVVGS